MSLTEIECRKAKCPPDRKYIRLSDERGMYLEVSISGGKYWRLKYRFQEKEKRLALGVYPDVTLAEARRAREEARIVLARGDDPGQLKQVAKLNKWISNSTTFESVSREWWEHWKGNKSERYAEDVLRRLSADVFPQIGSAPIASITAPQVLAVCKKIEERDALEIAKRSFQKCGQIFRYAVAHNLVDRNPIAELKPSDALQPRKKENYARLDIDEFPGLLRKIEAYQGSSYTRLAMKLMALTFVRTSELINAQWSEFDLEAAEWRIPAGRMKMKTPHIVPLAPQALDVLEALKTISGSRPHLFPGERDHDKSMSNNTILGALKRMGYQGKMTGHGFRGVASTLLHELGYEPHLIEVQLAHQERNNVAAAYNYATYLTQRRKMMNDWANHLDSLRKTGQVLTMERKAA